MLQKVLKQVRRRLGYTQQQMADVLGLNRTYYNRIETGVYDLSPRVLECLRAIVTADELQDIKRANAARSVGADDLDEQLFGVIRMMLDRDFVEHATALAQSCGQDVVVFLAEMIRRRLDE